MRRAPPSRPVDGTLTRSVAAEGPEAGRAVRPSGLVACLVSFGSGGTPSSKDGGRARDWRTSMSGPKAFRVVTREQVIAICRGHLDRLDVAVAEWTRDGRRHKSISDAD